MRQLLALSASVALLGATPSPAPTPHPTLSVVCARAPLYVFSSGSDRPVRARTFEASLGQRFDQIGGPRSTLEGAQYYETNIVVTEPGYPPDAHYWINSACAIPTK